MSYKKDSIIYLIFIGILISILIGIPYFIINRLISKDITGKFAQFVTDYGIIDFMSFFLKISFIVILTSILIILFFI